MRKIRRHTDIPRGKRPTGARNRALHVLARMRRTGTSLTAAAREERIDPRTVYKYVGVAIRMRRASKSDRLQRNLLIPTTLGNTRIAVKGSKKATQLGRYMSAVGRFLRSGETDALDEFEGIFIGKQALITDPDKLSHLAQADALTLDEIYATPESSS